ncbi:pyridoxal phosphate-dependent aminotransferase [Thalassotalea ganghwensis]
MTQSLFSSENVPHQLLKQRAYNYRWAETEPDIIPLTAADPDFAVAKEIRHAIVDYALGGVFSYGPHQGLSEFKQALVQSMANRRDYQLNADYILPIDSVASGMYSVIQAFINEGDEAIIFDPVDFLFEQSVLAAKGNAIRCPYDHELGEFRLDMLEQLLTPKTKVIGVCNPHNPLGRLMTKKELVLIAEFANKHDLWIMNDEIWSDIVFPEKRFTSFHHLPSELTQRVITCYGFSKAFGLAGLRVGAIICPTQASYQSIVEASNVMTTAGGVATISQIAAITALKECWYWVDEFTAHLTQLRDYAVKRLNQMPGVTCHTPEATYLLFPNIELTGFSADEIVAHLLKYNVAVVPGNEKFFGPGASGHIRICFATSQEILTEGLDRMEQALNQLGSNENDAM